MRCAECPDLGSCHETCGAQCLFTRLESLYLKQQHCVVEGIYSVCPASSEETVIVIVILAFEIH
jgi:hypothetical protein